VEEDITCIINTAFTFNVILIRLIFFSVCAKLLWQKWTLEMAKIERDLHIIAVKVS
jgi:hypothetical protein